MHACCQGLVKLSTEDTGELTATYCFRQGKVSSPKFLLCEAWQLKTDPALGPVLPTKPLTPQELKGVAVWVMGKSVILNDTQAIYSIIFLSQVPDYTAS